ncbi:hypothetical protein A464_plas0117 (plasmid) [Salmonella bongori N268-08]|uniref:Uncharacterized protein n=1 Tax=Salmonella bongori N268-08 TaxID=1197719 RepID=S5MZ20_SALBN|nr:hypothetical protein A464_plas0117 [Salmonella bongori N268-08]
MTLEYWSYKFNALNKDYVKFNKFFYLNQCINHHRDQRKRTG